MEFGEENYGGRHRYQCAHEVFQRWRWKALVDCLARRIEGAERRRKARACGGGLRGYRMAPQVSALEALSVAAQSADGARGNLASAEDEMHSMAQALQGAADFISGTVGALQSAVELLDTETPKTLRAQAKAAQDAIDEAYARLQSIANEMQDAIRLTGQVKDECEAYLGKLQS